MLTPPDALAAAFVSSLRPFRRRLRWSLFARSAAVSGAIAFGLLNVVLLTVPPARTAAIPGWAGALALAMAAAWAVTLMRTPSLHETAATLDRDLQLQDRCVTAAQYAGASDAASALVVRDAVARLEGLSPALLPLRIPASRYWLTAVLAASAGLAGPLLQGSVTPDAAIGGGTDSGRTTGLHNPDSRSPSDARSAVAAIDAPMSEAPPEDQQGSTAKTPAGEAREPRPGSERAARPEEIASRSGQHGTAEPAANARDETRTNGADGERASSTRPPASADAPGRGGAGEGADRPARPSDSLSAAGRGGRGRGVGDGAAGGVAGGAVLPSAGRVNASGLGAAETRDTAAYRAAYARAEAALAREPIPPQLRSYVRGYFLAIRPEAAP
jgi:hypothetical protein